MCFHSSVTSDSRLADAPVLALAFEKANHALFEEHEASTHRRCVHPVERVGVMRKARGVDAEVLEHLARCVDPRFVRALPLRITLEIEPIAGRALLELCETLRLARIDGDLRRSIHTAAMPIVVSAERATQDRCVVTGPADANGLLRRR